MDLAIATDYRGEFRKIEDMEVCLREIAEAGFSHIHWCFDWTGDYIYSKAEMYQIREWMEQFDLLFARYPKEFLGFCLDTGHANLVWGDSFIEVLVELYKDRLFSIHMHDNKGWGDEPGCGDAHRLPGEGNIDWKRLMGVLRTSAYKLPWTLEVSKPIEEDAVVYLKRAKEASAWMDCQ